jgi:uncharacterized cupin superfamily protein
VLAHWDEVDGVRNAKGPMAATWQRLGDAAGAKRIGVNRVRIDPGRLSTPPHSHGRSEEIFYILDGSGLSWQDEKVCEVRRGDTIVHVANREEHTLRGGPDGLDYLVFGTRHPVELGWLPRSRAIRLGWPWVEGRDDDPWDVEAEIGELEFAEPGERPPNVVAFDDLPFDEDGDKLLAAAAGSEQSGLNWVRREAGRRGCPPHCHSLEAEAFVVLEGGGTLELWPAPAAASRGAQRELYEVRPGSVIGRPPASRIGHSLVAGPEGITYLAYGTREPNDIVHYQRSNKVYFRGVGLMTRLEHLDYGDGEPDDY